MLLIFSVISLAMPLVHMIPYTLVYFDSFVQPPVPMLESGLVVGDSWSLGIGAVIQRDQVTGGDRGCNENPSLEHGG
jgi:hypothetical protein